MMKRKLLALICVTVLVVGAFTGCAGKKTDNNNETVQEEKTTIRVGAMSGPTGMGMVKLRKDSEEGNTENDYEFADFATEASAFVTPLATGEIDIAAVPSNLAATIYNNTDGKVQVVAINNLGVLQLVTRDKNVTGISSLKGKTVYATGAGAVPEYSIKYVLSLYGFDPTKDVNLVFCSDTTEALAKIKADEGAVAFLPQPFATAAAAQVTDLKVVLSVDEAIEAKGKTSITTGVVVARTEFADKYPEQLKKFLEEYEDSLNYVKNNTDEGAKLVVEYGIVKAEAIAKKALPECSLTFMKGEDMKKNLENTYKVLYDYNSKSIGGKMPGDDFYYGCK